MTVQKISRDKFVCTKPDLTIITFDEIFDSVVIHVINIVYGIYGDMDLIKTLNTDIRKIFIHSLLEQIYKRIIQEKSCNSIIYINTSFTTNFSEIWAYIEKEKLEPFIIKTCKTISHKAPIPIFVEPGIIDLENNSGETKEVINKLEQTLTNFRKKVTSLSKLKKYSKDNGLMRFMENYHHPEDHEKNLFYHKYLKGV
jgi:hypothetical protein